MQPLKMWKVYMNCNGNDHKILSKNKETNNNNRKTSCRTGHRVKSYFLNQQKFCVCA